MRSISSPTVLVGAVLFAFSACVTVEDVKDGCEGDEHLCPSSSKTATGVVCKCTCQLPRVPVPGARSARFEGKLAACLPPALNLSLATPDERAALEEMPQAKYNQEVFRFCSVEMAEWLSLTVKSQLGRVAQVPSGLGCQPYKCQCATDGARATYPPCARRCEERTCDVRSCMPILRQEGFLETDSCICGRTEACGFVAPPRDKPALCRVLVPDSLND